MIRNLIVGAKSGNTNTLVPTKIQTFSNTTPVTQVSSVVLTTYTGVAGETFTVTINGYANTYTVLLGATGTTVLNALVTRINANANVNTKVSAVRSGTTLIVTSLVAGLPFIIASSDTSAAVDIGTPATPTLSSGANCWDIDFGALSFDAGDIVRASVGGVETSYTVPSVMTPSAVVSAFAALTNSNGSFYNRFGTQVLTVLANDYTTDVVLTCSTTNA